MSTKRALASTGIACGVILVLAAVSALLWWNPAPSPDSPYPLSPSLRDGLGLVWPTVLIAAYFGLIGLAVFVVLPRRRFTFTSAGLWVGIGLSVASLAIAVVRNLSGSATVLIVPLGVAAAVVLVVALARRIRTGAARATARRLGEIAVGATLRSGDLIVIVLIAALLLTVARFGATAWTVGIDDFHRYAGSAMVWLSDSGVGVDFATQHLDSFGAGMIARANGEKPAVTAMLVVASQLTGLAPYQLLTPLSVILMFVLVSSLVATVKSMFSVPPVWAVVFVAAPSLSVIPLSRVFDAQLGHLAVVAICALAVALSSQLRPKSGWRVWGPWALLVGVVLACALATNFTVALGAVPLIGALILWQLLRHGWRALGIAAVGGTAVAVVIALSIPLLRGYRRAFEAQSSGLAGAVVPFPSPTALLGQQIDLFSSPEGMQLVVEWSIVLAATLAVVLPRVRKSLDFTMVLVVVLVSFATTLGLSFAYGPTNYIVHKSVATTISLAVPLVLATALVAAELTYKRPVRVATALFASSALVISSAFGYGVRIVIPQSLVSLQSDSRLASVPALNVDLDDTHLNSIGGLIPPSETVRVLGPTYADASPPVGDTYLIPTTSSDRRSWTSISPLNESFALATLDLTIGAGTVSFVDGDSAGRNLLFGSWSYPEVTGRWSSYRDAFIVFDADSSLGDGDIVVTLTGTHYADPTAHRTLTFTVNGVGIRTITSSKAEERSYRLVIPRELIVDGRVSIGLFSDQGLSPLALGGLDNRNLIFRATSMLVEAG